MAKEIDPNDPTTKDPYPDLTNPKDLLGVKKAPLHLVPPALRIAAAPALADGARKYGAYNWREKKVKLSVYLAAMQRHIDAIWDGQDVAEDSGIDHFSHAIACLAIIVDARAIDMLVDDRPTPGGAAKLLAEQDQTRKAEPAYGWILHGDDAPERIGPAPKRAICGAELIHVPPQPREVCDLDPGHFEDDGTPHNWPVEKAAREIEYLESRSLTRDQLRAADNGFPG